MKKKTFNLSAIENKDGTVSMGTTGSGFNIFEIIGILETKKDEMVKKMTNEADRTEKKPLNQSTNEKTT